MLTLASALLAICLLWMSKTAKGSVINEQFWQFRFSSDIARGNYVFTASVSTASTCGNLCVGFPSCQSYGFNSGSRTCWLYNHLYTSNGTAAPGTRYFRRLSPRCPTELNYTLEEGLCFKVHRQRLSFLQARDFCADEGGSLFITDTLAKVDLLQGHVTKWTWVGGSESEVEGDWWWEDGQKLDISSSLWTPGRPDDVQNHDGLVVGRTGQLDDAPSSTGRHVACQLPLL